MYKLSYLTLSVGIVLLLSLLYVSSSARKCNTTYPSQSNSTRSPKKQKQKHHNYTLQPKYYKQP